MVFFGFTGCSSIYPVTLSALTQTLKGLGEDSTQIVELTGSQMPLQRTYAILKLMFKKLPMVNNI